MGNAALKIDLLDAEDVARILGCSRKVAYGVISRLEHVKLGTGTRPRLRIASDVIEKFIKQGGDKCLRSENTSDPSTGTSSAARSARTARFTSGNSQPSKPTSEPQPEPAPQSSWRARFPVRDLSRSRKRLKSSSSSKSGGG